MKTFYVVAGDTRHFERFELLERARARQEAPGSALRFVEVRRPSQLQGVTLLPGDEFAYCGTWDFQPYWLVHNIKVRQRLLEDRRDHYFADETAA